MKRALCLSFALSSAACFRNLPAQADNDSAGTGTGETGNTSDGSGSAAAESLSGSEESVSASGTGSASATTGDEATVGETTEDTGTKPEVIVLGQPDEFSNIELERGFSYPPGVLVVGKRLVVADTWNQRLLIWNTIPTSDGQPPDLVVGQPALNTVTGAPPGADTVYPAYFAPALGTDSGAFGNKDGMRLLLADTYYQRVLVWNSLPTSNYQAADLVLGQPDFTSAPPPDQLFVPMMVPPSSQTLNIPVGVSSDGMRLFVADMVNHRVLIWNEFPSANNGPADIVLGQPSLDTNLANNCTILSECLADPRMALVVGSSLFVADSTNHRVLVWTTLPTSNQEGAQAVLGQPDMMLNGPNVGGTPAANTMSKPLGLASNGTHLVVADADNHRVLVWNTLPGGVGAGPAASVVVGQPDFAATDLNHGSNRPDARGVNGPVGVAIDADRLYVADSGNARVTIWNTIPTENYAPADVVLGKPDLTAEFLRPVDGRLTGHVNNAFFDGQRFLAAQAGRVLVWDHLPLDTDDRASLVLGQPTLMSWGGKPEADAIEFKGVGQIWADADHVIVPDAYRHRVMIWNGSLASGEAADIVLGQPDFMSTAANNGGIGANTVFRPWGVWSDGTRLVMSDTNNHRVLIWNTFPTQNGQPADVVLGQFDMESNYPNDNEFEPNSETLEAPLGVTAGGDMLFVVDGGNHRILIWNTFPTDYHQPADVVIGQPDMFTATPNVDGVSARSLNQPGSVTVHAGRIFVSDTGNNRVLGWSTLPSDNYAEADWVYGQTDFESRHPNDGGLSGTTLASPGGIYAFEGWLSIADGNNNRVLLVPVPP